VNLAYIKQFNRSILLRSCFLRARQGAHLIWAEPEAFDAKSYAIYILTDGTIMEKRELLFNLKRKNCLAK